MRVCDRCRGEKNVQAASAWFVASPSETSRNVQADLCEHCATIIRRLFAAAPWKADELLKVLDGEPSPETLEKAQKALEAGEEIPFDAAGTAAAEVAAAKWREGVLRAAEHGTYRAGVEASRRRAGK